MKNLLAKAMAFGSMLGMVLLITGCISDPQSNLGDVGKSAGPNEGEIVVQRPIENGPFASNKLEVVIDGQIRLSLGNFEEGKVILPNGNHLMYVKLISPNIYFTARSENIPLSVNSNRITFTATMKTESRKNVLEVSKTGDVALGGAKTEPAVVVSKAEPASTEAGIVVRQSSGGYNTEVSDQAEVYVGVVAFNNQTSEFVLTNQLGQAKNFINSKQNDIDSTALCYAVSKATTLFGASDLPAFDNTFVVSFTDGVDNSSSNLYTNVPQAQVYDRARTDLSGIAGVKSFAIGLGSSLNATNMEKLVLNGGEYKTATNAATLNQVFLEIANSVLSSSKNVVLATQPGLYTEEYPKYFRITVNASPTADSSATVSSTITCKLVGNTFSVIQPSPNVSFTNPVTGTAKGGKIEIPLNNLKYMSDGRELYIQSTKVEVSTSENSEYYEDVEDASASTKVLKKIGVVLVLDCSTSLGEAFASLQASASNFIDTLAQQLTLSSGDH